MEAGSVKPQRHTSDHPPIAASDLPATPPPQDPDDRDAGVDAESAAGAAAQPPELSAEAMRQAKLAALQRAIDAGTYSVPAEQLAEKLLRDALLEDLP
jgi:anti-sigma28 factor (negative regulator of flagellin synthesis)